MTRKILTLALLVCSLLASCGQTQTEEPPTPFLETPPTAAAPQNQTQTYAPSSAEIPNPERGFFDEVDFSEEDLNWYAELSGNTLARLPARLDEYRNRDLPQEYLQALDSYFELGRAAGIKFILRFSYNDGPYPNSEPDAPLEQVLRHIEQLAPILQKNVDEIAWFEAGFIGAWGEWHTSTNGLDSSQNRVIIRDALFAQFPANRFILFRYPGDLIEWYPVPLEAPQAFDKTPQARAGHHNDCFLASADDEGTYLDSADLNQISAWQNYLSQTTRFVPMSGETCAVNPPRSDCETALQEMNNLHWTSINEGWHPDVIQRWREQGCYAEIRQKLGYRLALQKTTYPPIIQTEKEINVSVEISNAGFSAPVLERPIYLILAGQDEIFKYEVNADPRLWAQGESSFAVSFILPANAPSGEYQLALWLPDSAPSLQNDPRYAIQFANEGVWNAARGWNTLGKIQVAAAKP